MPLNDILRLAISAALTALLLWAAFSDFRTRLIPNRCVLAVLALYGLWAVLSPATVPGSIAVGAGALVVFYVLYAFNIVGAGDAKLFAAVALFAGQAYLGPYAMGTVLCGGAMALVSLASRPRRALVIWHMRGKGDFGRGVPYGCAIAFGGIVMQWGQVLGYLTPNTLVGALGR